MGQKVERPIDQPGVVYSYADNVTERESRDQARRSSISELEQERRSVDYRERDIIVDRYPDRRRSSRYYRAMGQAPPTHIAQEPGGSIVENAQQYTNAHNIIGDVNLMTTHVHNGVYSIGEPMSHVIDVSPPQLQSVPLTMIQTQEMAQYPMTMGNVVIYQTPNKGGEAGEIGHGDSTNSTSNGNHNGTEEEEEHIPWYSHINPLAVLNRKRKQKQQLRDQLTSSGAPSLMLEWFNIEFKVKTKSNSKSPFKGKRNVKQILFPQSAHVAPGQIMAIMGPSGCGKTSLLNIISQRVKKYEGEVRVNGKIAGKNLGGLMAFVQQDDVLIGNLTVSETLRYAAHLRLPSKMTRKEKRDRVDDVVKELNLTSCKDTLVGQPGIKKGISGGERKRLAIAVELLTRPSVLFLDEPSTGLDASAALHLMHLLRKVAQKGRTIVLTIHQPRSNIFQLFDRLLLLVKGKLVYFGEAQDAVPYFAKLGYEMPPNYNPADYLLDLLSVTSSDEELSQEVIEQDEKRVQNIIDSYTPNTQDEVILSDEMKKTNLKHYLGYPSTWLTQFWIIFLRSYQVIRRNTVLTLVRFIQTIVLAVIVGLIFLRLGYTQVNVQDRAGVLFFIMLNQMMNSLMTGLSLFSEERPVFLRERAARAYHVSSYFFGKIFSQLPQIVYPILFGCIIYYMVNLNPGADNFFKFLGLLVLASYCSLSIGETISACTKSTQMAQAIAILMMIILILFSGFYANTSTLPVFLIWGPYASPFRYAYESFFLNEFRGETFTCSDGEACRFRTGQDVIAFFHYDSAISEIWIDVLFLFAFILLSKTLTYLALVFLNRPKGA